MYECPSLKIKNYELSSCGEVKTRKYSYIAFVFEDSIDIRMHTSGLNLATHEGVVKRMAYQEFRDKILIEGLIPEITITEAFYILESAMNFGYFIFVINERDKSEGKMTKYGISYK